MTFHVGQKIVCVDDSLRGGPWHSDVVPPVIGGIYTVERGNYLDESGDEVVHLVELCNRWGFLASRFRPIVERKTDISIFTAMLNPSKKRIDA